MNAENEGEAARLRSWTPRDRQPDQNNQVDTYITKGVNALIVVMDRTAAAPLMLKRRRGSPIVFVNREPQEEGEELRQDLYVGAKAEESGIFVRPDHRGLRQGEQGRGQSRDSKIQYIMIRGEQGRKCHAPHRVLGQGHEGQRFELEELGSDTANWDKVQGANKMKGSFISAVGLDRIRPMLANNDATWRSAPSRP